MRRFLLPELAGFFLLIFIYNAVVRSLLAPIIQLPVLLGGVSTTLTLALFSLFHALYLFGWKRATLFIITCVVISWGFEQVGVATGLVYGSYYYTDVLGVKLGHVPISIPAAWFMMMYPSHVMANMISAGEPISAPKGIQNTALVSLLTAAIMTAWDLAIDPIMSGPEIRAWVWEGGGLYFGVPLRNFAGWMTTAFSIDLVFRLLTRTTEIREGLEVTRAIKSVPVVGYAAMMFAAILAGGRGSEPVIALVCMGLPVALAMTANLFHRSRLSSVENSLRRSS